MLRFFFVVVLRATAPQNPNFDSRAVFVDGDIEKLLIPAVDFFLSGPRCHEGCDKGCLGAGVVHGDHSGLRGRFVLSRPGRIAAVVHDGLGRKRDLDVLDDFWEVHANEGRFCAEVTCTVVRKDFFRL